MSRGGKREACASGNPPRNQERVKGVPPLSREEDKTHTRVMKQRVSNMALFAEVLEALRG